MPRARTDSIEPYATRLRADLAGIRAGFLEVVDASGTAETDPNRGEPSGVVFVGFPLWGWAASSPGLTVQRMRALGEYRAWRERLGLLFPRPTREVSNALAEADTLIESWLARTKPSHDVPASIPAAHERATAVFATLDQLLDLTPTGDDTMRLVPDTNALLANSDLASYAALVDASRYEVVLLPTVLANSTTSKTAVVSRSCETKRKRWLGPSKGLRDKGRLTAGVPLTKAMTVRAEHRDLDPSAVLGWLTRETADDALLAGALTLQRRTSAQRGARHARPEPAEQVRDGRVAHSGATARSCAGSGPTRCRDWLPHVRRTSDRDGP